MNNANHLFNGTARLVLCGILSFGFTQSVYADDKAPSGNPHAGMMMAAPGANPHQPANPHGAGSFAVGDRKEINWTAPKEWKELPPTSMRLGNFMLDGKEGQKIEITVAALPGEAGGVTANFGMWRSQLGLPQVDEAELKKETEKFKHGDLVWDFTDIVSTDNVIDGKSKARIIGAILVHGANTWFFKMKGEDAAVEAAKPQFFDFLTSVSFATK